LKNNTFNPSSLSAYLYNDVIVFSYYNKVRDILKPIIRNKCISLSYLRKSKIFKIPFTLGFVKFSYVSHFIKMIKFRHEKIVNKARLHHYTYEYLHEKWFDTDLILQFTTDENNNPAIKLFYNFNKYKNYTHIKSVFRVFNFYEYAGIRRACDCLINFPYLLLTQLVFCVGKTELVHKEVVSEYESKKEIPSFKQLYTISSSTPPVPFRKPKYICLIED